MSRDSKACTVVMGFIHISSGVPGGNIFVRKGSFQIIPFHNFLCLNEIADLQAHNSDNRSAIVAVQLSTKYYIWT